jgi:hypothetical protein
MRRVVRVSVGLVVVMVLAYVWLPGSTGYWIPLGMLLMGLVGGFIAGSRWAVALTPIAIMAPGWLHHRITCADCPPGTDPTFGVVLVYLAVMLGLAALGARAGVAGSGLVSRAWSSPQELGGS